MNPRNSHTYCQVAQADTQAKTCQGMYIFNSTTDRQKDKEQEELGGNSGFKKVAVKWLNVQNADESYGFSYFWSGNRLFLDRLPLETSVKSLLFKVKNTYA